MTAISGFVLEDGECRLDDSFTIVYAVPSAMPTTGKKRRLRDAELVDIADLVDWPDV